MANACTHELDPSVAWFKWTNGEKLGVRLWWFYRWVTGIYGGVEQLVFLLCNVSFRWSNFVGLILRTLLFGPISG